jgi:hypothetical protein
VLDASAQAATSFHLAMLAFHSRVLLSLVLFGALRMGAFAADFLETPITKDSFDPETFAEWVDGAERPIQGSVPAAVIYTQTPALSHTGQKFGESAKPGLRHLRVGVKSAVPVGAVMTRGGGRVSVLKADAPFPGNLADDSQWIPAQRIKDGKLATDEAGQQNYALWTLPQVVQTRAIRFTHQAAVTDRVYEGYLGGAYVLPERVANVATQGTPVVSENERYAERLINEQMDPSG